MSRTNRGRNVLPGDPSILGATVLDGGVNFALFSADAERVDLCLYADDDRTELERIELPARDDGVWHGFLPECVHGTHYGYRVHGAYEPQAGFRFNAHKLLIDPYARALSGSVVWSDACYGFRPKDCDADLSFSSLDSAGSIPKGVVVDPTRSFGPALPGRRWEDTVIYETHLRGFTMRHPALFEREHGTFAGLGAPPVVDYLRSLGITAVELLPVQAFTHDHFLVKKGLRNYWGYSPLGYFAPHPEYVPQAGRAELLKTVRALHEAGIEVLLDVVYNHTAEGNQLGPTLSFRGIDNRTYYRLNPHEPRYYTDWTGCGNTLNFAHPRVRALVLDSLRCWATELEIDGFRFDLASTVARGEHGFEADGEMMHAIAEDPVLKDRKLIAEPWDLGPEGYRLGGFPPGWAEWNDRFRDVVRRFWRDDVGQLPEFARRVHGSSDLFEDGGRAPWAGINFVTAHDGFTLSDLVSFRQRHNRANLENNQDGHRGNFSNNCGAEGPSANPRVLEDRQRRRRNLLATVFLAQGTPMLLAGDEFGRTQNGNNNAYCQDNPTSWLDWSGLERDPDWHVFVRGLIRLRAEHPVLRRGEFVHGDIASGFRGFPNIGWHGPNGEPMSVEQWHDPHAGCLGLFLAGKFAPPADRRPWPDVLLSIFNRGRQELVFRLPKSPSIGGWRALFTTTTASGEPVGETLLESDEPVVEANSVWVLAPERRRRPR